MAICSLFTPEDLFRISISDYDFVNSKGDLSEKMLAIADILQLSDGEIREREKIRSNIVRFLKPFYPDCIVYPFGSSMNGFGCKGCDIDLLFLPFPEYCNLDFEECKNVPIPHPSSVKDETYPKEQLLTMNESCHLRFILRIMNCKRYYFRKVVYIPAKCPILYIQFMQSNITCDFSASNRLVISNTELQWLYGKLDFRVKPLVMCLRYWAKSLGFIRKSLLSSYAFSFLVIFYLQNTHPPVLPSVKSLIEVAGYSRKIDNWETAICENSILSSSTNTDSVGQLLIGFCEFYWNFDFVHNIVSPHLGKALPVKELLESNDERIKTFQVTPFSIQDPFILSRNISRNASMKTSFKLALLIAKRLLLQGDFPFQNFFDITVYEAQMDGIFAPVLQNLHDSSFSNSVHLSYELCCKLGGANKLYDWHETLCQTVLDVLQYGLLFQCEVVDKIIRTKNAVQRPRKKKKLNHNKVANLELIMSIQCTAYYNTWHSRKKTEKSENNLTCLKDLPSSAVLLKEHIISESMIDGNRNTESALVWFFCNCYAYSSAQITDVVLIFSPLTNVSVFSSLAGFLKSNVQKLVKKILSES